MRAQLDIDHRIAGLAERQAGVASFPQLIALGLSKDGVRRRVEAGRLHPLHRGVFAVGHRRLDILGGRWAAVLALGDGAVLSDGPASDGWGLMRFRGRPHVTVPPPGGRARRKGIVVHRRALLPDEVTRLRGLPITTPARTLLDLAAGGVRGHPLERALHHAERALRIDWGELHTLLERHARRPGVPELRRTLARFNAGALDTHSRLEEIVGELCSDHGIPLPQANVVVAGRTRDFVWPERHLVVEADGYTWHGTPTALDEDRERDVELVLAGLSGLRFTYQQCTERPGYVGGSILAALRRPVAAIASAA
jgi:hypothetical protein